MTKPLKHGITDLMLVASSGDLAAVKDLIEQGADVNARDNFGYSALMYAASAGHTSVAEKLLAHGGDVEAKNQNGLTGLDLAIANGREDIARTFRQSRLLFAARDGDLELVRELLDRGADVNVQGTNGWTALTIATFHNHPHIVSMLLLRGADTELQTNTKRTALMIAQREEHQEIINLLHYYDAKPLSLYPLNYDNDDIPPISSAEDASRLGPDTAIPVEK